MSEVAARIARHAMCVLVALLAIRFPAGKAVGRMAQVLGTHMHVATGKELLAYARDIPGCYGIILHLVTVLFK